MKLSIIVPVFNEVNHLEQVIQSLMESPCPIDREWVFVDDRSTDGSLEVIRRLQSTYGYRVLEQTENLGKGMAVIKGIEVAAGEFIMIQDADFEYDPNDVPYLLEPLIEGNADVVYGSRFKKNTDQVHRTYHYLINRFLTMMSNLLSGMYLSDMETCYKVFRADLLKSMRLRCKRFGIEVEMTAYLAKTKARIFERPIRYYPRTYFEGKKINWKDGAAALWHLIRFNLLIGEKQAFTDLPERYCRRP